MSTPRNDAKGTPKKQCRDWLKVVVDNSPEERWRQQVAAMSDEQLDAWIARHLSRMFN